MKRNSKYLTPRAEVLRIQELRRSNAAQPIQSKKAYTRKQKHKETYL